MSYSGEGHNVRRFRDTTEKTTRTMAGVMFGSFWCRKCDRSRPVKGRKSAGWKA